MDKINILLVDPEEESRVYLRTILRKHFPEVEVLAEVSQRSDIIASIKTLKPDVVFLDILYQGQSIFGILDKVKGLDCHLAFVTTHSEYALKGYQYNPLGFILKPVAIERVQEVISRARTLIRMARPELADEWRAHTQLPASQPEGKIAVADSKGLHVFHLDEIMYCLGDRNYTTFKLHDGQTVVVSKTLKYFDDKLHNTSFFRAHKSNLINLNYVKMVTKEDGGVIRMYDQKELPISRARKKELYRRLEGHG